MTTISELLTANDLLALGDVGRSELIRGELIMMSPASANHGMVAARLLIKVGSFVELHDLGATFAAETGFRIESDPDTVRAPDVSFVIKKRLSDGLPQRGYFDGPPDLAVEVISPDETRKKVIAKARMWIQKGCKSCWVVDPLKREIVIFRTGRKPITLRETSVLRNEPTLPGFVLHVAEIFRLT